MRVCPRCKKEYADSVAFCFVDGIPTDEVVAVAVDPLPAVSEPAVPDGQPLPQDEDATDAPSLSEVSVDLQATPEPVATEPVATEPVATEPVATEPPVEPEETAAIPDAGPERIDAPLAQKDFESDEAFLDQTNDDLGGFDSDHDDEPIEPVGRPNGLLIGMGIAAALMLGVGGWLLWQSFSESKAVTDQTPVVEEPVVVEEPAVVEEPVVEEPVVEEPVVEPVVEPPPERAGDAREPAKSTSGTSSSKKKASTTKVGLGEPEKGSKVGRAKKKGEPEAGAEPVEEEPVEENPWGEIE